MKKFASIMAVVVFFALFGATISLANDKRPALPSRVLTARTVFVDNQTTSAELQNTAYTELNKWGRLQIVDTLQKADLVLRLSSGNYVKFVPGGSSQPASASQPSKPDSQGTDEAVPPGSTRISLIDPKSGNSFWSDICKTNNPKAATHMLDGLRLAFDQKEITSRLKAYPRGHKLPATGNEPLSPGCRLFARMLRFDVP